MIVDSGTRREFKSGAVRDIQEGKGREDLLPLAEVGKLTGSPVIKAIASFKKTHDPGFLHEAILEFCLENGWDMWTALLEVGIHFEEGAKKYGDNNWRKGIDCHCYLDSALRHYFKWRRGDHDENHDRAVIWNLLCLEYTMTNKPELMDLDKECNCMVCEFSEQHPTTKRFICNNYHSEKYKEAVTSEDTCKLFMEF